MAPAKKQRQAQKQQEQQISQALAQTAPKSSHRSFEDDDDDVVALDDDSVQQTQLSVVDQIGSADSEDDADDAPIEVVSNKISRKQAAEQASKVKAQEKEARVRRQETERKRAEQKRKDDAQAAESDARTRRTAPAVAPVPSTSASNPSDTEQASGPSRLDPSLFAEVFSKPVTARKSILKRRTAEEEADIVAKLQAEKKKRRKEQRSGGVILGRDGLPMKRIEDGTIIRALDSTAGRKKTDFDAADESDSPLDAIVRPTLLDPTISLPNAKARAYKKRHLEKKGLGQSKVQTATASKASQKSDDDPLGLNDPAFLPGGEYYHLVNKKKDSRGKTAGVPGDVAKQGFRGGGTRKEAVSVLRSRSRAGPSLGFARSQS